MSLYSPEPDFNHRLFGEDFKWGVSASAFQTEGAYNIDGKGLSNWDVFSALHKKIRNNENAHHASEFYYRFAEDIAIIKALGIRHFRFSVSWSRLLPNGTGPINQQGVDFYNRVIDTCLLNGIQPWLTLYHWDLPQVLEHKGGWVNRDIINWFQEYVALCTGLFGDRVKHWMLLNEPMVFTGAGYFLGIHAPGKKGLKNFLPAIHHAVLCQSLGSRIIREKSPQAEIGSTFSCSYVTPNNSSKRDQFAALRIDTLLNRLFAEPSFGLGYPVNDLPLLKRIEKYMKQGDEQAMQADFDFIGIQNYTREVVAYSFFIPYLQAHLIPASKRKIYHTVMNWEVYPEAIYEMIKKFSSYKQVKKIYITENGAAFPDKVENNAVHDHERIHFISSYLKQVLKAKEEGLKVNGYFVWSLTDNFEWAEGYFPRFGLVHIDFSNQKRIIKDSGYWYRDFLG